MYQTKQTPITADERKVRVQRLFEHHKPVFDALRIDTPYFFPKIPWTTVGMSEQGVGMYESELRKGDTYVELIDQQYNPIDQERKLYKVRQNPHVEEYIENMGRYMVPLSELIEVKMPLSTRNVAPAADFFDTEIDNDALIDRMTVRDFAAIMLRKPVSQKAWLNKLIQSS
jgi:hypothetical protein